MLATGASDDAVKQFELVVLPEDVRLLFLRNTPTYRNPSVKTLDRNFSLDYILITIQTVFFKFRLKKNAQCVSFKGEREHKQD